MVASDIPEVIGSAIGLRLLFGIPTWVGIVVTAIDSVLFLALGAYGVRKLEALMGALVGAMSISWLIVLSRADFDAGEVVVGMLRPSIPDRCGPTERVARAGLRRGAWVTAMTVGGCHAQPRPVAAGHLRSH